MSEVDGKVETYFINHYPGDGSRETVVHLVESEANARLISLAPEMLGKLEVALRRLEEKNDGSNRDLGLINGIKALISRAEGDQ